MTELRIGKRGYCSMPDCAVRTDLPRWDGTYRDTRFILCGRCWGRYSDVCRAIDKMLAKEAA